MLAVVALGTGALLFSAGTLPVARLDLHFLLMGVLVCISSHVAVRIPRVSGRITVSDTLIFLTLLLYGGAAAVILSALEGVYASLRISRKPVTILFNAAVLALSTFLTATTLRALFGAADLAGANDYSAYSLAAVFVMALVQYVANTGLIAVEKSLKLGERFWPTWKTYYLWTSVTYLAGASAAGATARLVQSVGFYAVLATLPVIAIIYFTYLTYLKNIEVSEAHVEELSRFLRELKQSEALREQILIREQAARAEAEAANRVKDEFLSTLSHELRTPLTSIIGWANLMRAGQVKGEVQAQALETIERNARIQSRLIDDLLDLSRIISGKLLLDTREVELDAVVSNSIDVVRPAANAKGIRLTYEFEPGAKTISGDSARLQQVAWNLLSNAVKFTPEGGEVRVRLVREGARVRFAVSDTGKGIAAEFLPHVFDRFRQADSATTRAYGGLGLGLAIVRHLVELHGGDGAGRERRRGARLDLLRNLPARAGARVLMCAREGGRGGRRHRARRGTGGHARPRRGRRAGHAQSHQHGHRAVGGGGHDVRDGGRGAGDVEDVATAHPDERHRHARRGRLRAHPTGACAPGRARWTHARGGAHRLRPRRRPHARPRRRLPAPHRQTLQPRRPHRGSLRLAVFRSSQ